MEKGKKKDNEDSRVGNKILTSSKELFPCVSWVTQGQLSDEFSIQDTVNVVMIMRSCEFRKLFAELFTVPCLGIGQVWKYNRFNTRR